MVFYMTHNQSSDDRAPGASTEVRQPQPEPNLTERALPPEALRALAEAEERRRTRDAQNANGNAAVELGGRAGPDPTRYGDWEKGGIASDF